MVWELVGFEIFYKKLRVGIVLVKLPAILIMSESGTEI